MGTNLFGPLAALFLPTTPLPSIPNRRIPIDFTGECHVKSAGARRVIEKQIGSPVKWKERIGGQ
jgi:hypothetical protein